MEVNNSIVAYPLLLAGNRSVKNYMDAAPGTGGGVANTIIKNTIFRSGNGTWHTQGGTDGGGNLINADPRFFDTLGDFRLRCGSPAIN